MVKNKVGVRVVAIYFVIFPSGHVQDLGMLDLGYNEESIWPSRSAAEIIIDLQLKIDHGCFLHNIFRYAANYANIKGPHG